MGLQVSASYFKQIVISIRNKEIEWAWSYLQCFCQHGKENEAVSIFNSESERNMERKQWNYLHYLMIKWTEHGAIPNCE